MIRSNFHRHPILALSVLIGALVPVAVDAAGSDWPQWRGPEATGVAPDGAPPVHWSETSNLRWKTPLPGIGLSTPILWRDRVFVTTTVPSEAAPKDEEPNEGADTGRRRMPSIEPTPAAFTVMALDRTTGAIVWKQVVREGKPHEGTHGDASWASASPVTDGKRLIAHFGSNGTYALDLNGKLLWKKDLGDMTTRNGFGEGSSPVLYDDLVLINWDHEGQSFVIALDAATGETRWQVERDEITSWSTPLVVEVGGKPQAIISATGRSRGYALASGDVLWELGGMTTNSIPSPVHADGRVFVTSGFRGNALQAIDLAAAKGDLSESKAVAWTFDQDTPYVPSPLLVDGRLYLLKHNSAVLSAFDARSGERLYGPERIAGLGGVYASPVAAASRIYVVDREGKAAVLRAGPKFEELASNQLDDAFDASPAIVGDALFLRGRRNLYCLADGGAEAKTKTN